MNCKTASVRAWRANTPEGEIIRVVCAAHTHSRIAETFRQNWANSHFCHPLLAEWAYSNSTLALEERFRHRPELPVHFSLPAVNRYGELDQLQQMLREEPAEWETDQAIRRQRMAEDSPGGATVCKIRTEAVEPWAKAAGQSVREYVAAAVRDRIAANKEKADKSGKSLDVGRYAEKGDKIGT